MDSLTIHLFKVFPSQGSPAFETLLQQAYAMPLLSRKRTIGFGTGYKARLEALVPPSHGQTIWKLDFARLRDNHGPGKATDQTMVIDVPLAQGEVFAEETAAIYDSATGHLAVQYHPMGVRATGIVEYVEAILGNAAFSYSCKPVLDPQVNAKLANATLFRKLTFSVVPSVLSPEMRAENVSLSNALQATSDLGPQVVNMEIAVGRARNVGLNLTTVTNWINTLSSWLGQDESSVTQFKVATKADQDAATEVLDLLEQRLKLEFHNLQPGPGLRVPRTDRWDRLQIAYNHWQTII